VLNNYFVLFHPITDEMVADFNMAGTFGQSLSLDHIHSSLAVDMQF
jgi:hypothetical protein